MKSKRFIMENLTLTKAWDKTFPKSDKVNHKKVTFQNRFGVTLAADLYVPKGAKSKLPAIAVSGPFGAGESGGQPRYVASPDINTEDFQAAVDYLTSLDNVDPEKIGVIGICGWGGMALNAAAIDTRIKATVASTMYDMSRVNAYGYFDSTDVNARYELKKALNEQRIKDFKNGEFELGGGVAEVVPDDAPFYVRDYHDYYKTKRGYHKRSLNSNGGWNKTSALSFINTKSLSFINEIRNAVLIIHGEKANSCYFSKDAYVSMIKNNKFKANKELMIIPNAVHTDLYDKLDIIPFDKMEEFFRKNLK